ncbi:MAG: hypothetical protein IT376_13415 [Polyangiaceae bacterium]|nr:hypothetical protein [Polyangiaceae bacterium]
MACAASARSAQAQDAAAAAAVLPPPPQGAADAEPPPPNVSVTLSPVHLVLPVVELKVEGRVGEFVGLAAIGGYGSTSVEVDGVSEAFTTFELGAQVAAYPLQPFRSLQVGAEVLYVSISGNVEDVEGNGDGVAVGPFVGYKFATDGGFTFVAQVGAQYLAAQAKAEDAGGTSAAADESAVVPLVNLDLGWSF